MEIFASFIASFIGIMAPAALNYALL